MAITLDRAKLTVDLGSVVSNSITAVKAVRKGEQARKEAEFQRAISNGLSYEEQIKMREEQLKEENTSSFSDTEYILTLEKNIADTKKLNRFNKYRTRYAESLGELSAGKINEEQYLSTLENQLSGIDDPELRLEIQGDVAAARTKVKTYNDTILSNRVKKAKYDGTKDALNEVIGRVNVARASALINDNQDEVTAYDETLSALNSQISSVRIQDSITDFQVKSSTRGTNPVEKLNYINSEIQSADPNTAIKIGDRTYTSAQQFWSLERDNFLAGSSQIFGNFFDELDTHTKNAINVNAAKFGYPTQTILDEAFATFSGLRSKPEMTPFLNRLDITQATVMSEAVDKLAKTINAVGTNNLTFQEADIQLQNIATKYGIDVSGYRLQLDEQLRNLARGGVIDQAEATRLAPDVSVELPKIGAEKPIVPPGATPPVTPTTPVVGSARAVRAGETLSGIAKESGIGLAQLLELNPQFKQNPNIIRPGQIVNLPGAAPIPPVKDTTTTPVVPPVEPVPKPVPIPTPVQTPPVGVLAPTPVPPVASQTPPVKIEPRVYVVKSGDTLSGISKSVLGNASRWKELKSDIGESYDEETAKKLKVGTKLIIPQ